MLNSTLKKLIRLSFLAMLTSVGLSLPFLYAEDAIGSWLLAIGSWLLGLLVGAFFATTAFLMGKE